MSVRLETTLFSYWVSGSVVLGGVISLHIHEELDEDQRKISSVNSPGPHH